MVNGPFNLMFTCSIRNILFGRMKTFSLLGSTRIFTFSFVVVVVVVVANAQFSNCIIFAGRVYKTSI